MDANTELELLKAVRELDLPKLALCLRVRRNDIFLYHHETDAVTALHYAAMHHASLPVCHELLDSYVLFLQCDETDIHNPHVNLDYILDRQVPAMYVRDSGGRFPADVAVMYRSFEAYMFFLDHGYDIWASCYHPLGLAMECADSTEEQDGFLFLIFNIISSEATINPKLTGGNFCMCDDIITIACEKARVQSLQLLIDFLGVSPSHAPTGKSVVHGSLDHLADLTETQRWCINFVLEKATEQNTPYAAIARELINWQTTGRGLNARALYKLQR